jgi:hypothetical protein
MLHLWFRKREPWIWGRSMALTVVVLCHNAIVHGHGYITPSSPLVASATLISFLPYACPSNFTYFVRCAFSAKMSDDPSAQLTRVEAPVTLKAYIICAFAAFGGIFFGYDSGYVNGVLGKLLLGTIDLQEC